MENIRLGGVAETGYMGGQKWTGVNSGEYMTYAEINKIVKKEFSKKYPKVKISCRGKSFSGGRECHGTVKLPENEIMVDYEQFLNSDYEPSNRGWYVVEGECVYGEHPKLTREIKMKSLYEQYKKMLKGYSGVSMTHIRELDRLLFKPEVIEKLEYLNALYDSFNSYDVNGMVDYFDVNFYKDVYLSALD